MKQWNIWICSLLAAGMVSWLPHPGKDIADLEPVEIVLIRKTGPIISLETDTGASGAGNNLNAALRDLHRHALGEVFLDTADYIIIEGLEKDTQINWELFRPGCRICSGENISMDKTLNLFLKEHPPAIRVKDILAGNKNMQKLVQQGEQFDLHG